MKTLLETTSDKYLRRLAKAINAQRYGQPMTFTFATGEQRRVRAAKFSSGMLQVRTIGSDMWFHVYSFAQISGVSASRVA